MLKKPKRTTIAQWMELLGGAAVAFGVALWSIPAGIVIAGIATVIYALLIFNTDGAG